MKLEEEQSAEEAEKSEKSEKSGKAPARDEAGPIELSRAEAAEDGDDDDGGGGHEENVLRELVVLPRAAFAGRSATDMRLRTRYGVNLLAVSRRGVREKTRLRTLRIAPGDLLLMQGPPEALSEFAAEAGCVPLAERELLIPNPRKALLATLIMAGAVGGAALGLVPAAIAFAMGALASMALGTVPPRRFYDAIDWPVVVLLAALMPVASAMEATCSADLIAKVLLDTVARGHAVVALSLVLVVTMFLSDVMNNAATAAVMCPIAIGTASALGVNPDTFLMAVAVGASCAFLTPIGHQNVLVVSIPILLLVWPLR